MRKAALRSLMRPAEQRIMDADYLTQSVSLVLGRVDSRYVYLVRKAGKHANPQRDKTTGRTVRAVVDRLTQAGLLRFERALSREGSDIGQHMWIPEWPD